MLICFISSIEQTAFCKCLFIFVRIKVNWQAHPGSGRCARNRSAYLIRSGRSPGVVRSFGLVHSFGHPGSVRPVVVDGPSMVTGSKWCKWSKWCRPSTSAPRPGLYPETVTPSPCKDHTRHHSTRTTAHRAQDHNGHQKPKKHPKKAGQIQPGTVTPGAKKSPTASRANCYLS